MAAKVSAAVAARIAEKYPQHAAIAAEATVGELCVTEKVEAFVNEHDVLAKRTVVVSRHRKYRLPSGQTIVLDDMPEAPATPKAAPVVEEKPSVPTVDLAPEPSADAKKRSKDK